MQIRTADVLQFRQPGDVAVLGIIRTDGVVLLKRADAVHYAGHQDWIRLDGLALEQIAGGFSLLVSAGQVTHLMPASTLNRGPGYLLSSEMLAALQPLLPCAETFTVVQY